MGRKTVDHSQDLIAKGCVRALELASDPSRLAGAPCDQLGVAAAFLARAFALHGRWRGDIGSAQ